jgi:hypothetical protein
MNRVILTLTCILFLCSTSSSQNNNCSELRAIASMQQAQSMQALLKAKQMGGSSYRAKLVFAYRAFELNPGNKTDAQRLLALIPTSEVQQNAVVTLGDFLCDGESNADLLSLSGIRDGLARQLSKAIAIAPQYMSAYIQYSLNAIADPHSDYAIQMKKVCDRDHARFLASVTALTAEQITRFKRFVMNPDTCRPIAIPER